MQPVLYCTVLYCTDLYLPAGVDLVSAALPAAGPGAVRLAPPVLAPHRPAHPPRDT